MKRQVLHLHTGNIVIWGDNFIRNKALPVLANEYIVLVLVGHLQLWKENSPPNLFGFEPKCVIIRPRKAGLNSREVPVEPQKAEECVSPT